MFSGLSTVFDMTDHETSQATQTKILTSVTLGWLKHYLFGLKQYIENIIFTVINKL